jgi:hypothetical protein
VPIFSFIDLDFGFLEKQVLETDLILVDLDGVIFTPKQYLCSSYWYANYIHANKKFVDSKLMAHTELVNTLYECMSRTEFVSVDEYLISKLTSHASTRPIVGLTGRTINFREYTEIALNSLNMKFSDLDIEVYFKNQSIFRNGVVYVGHDPDTGLPWNKGHALDVFLEEYEGEINSVLLIDDIARNLLHLESYCQNNNLTFTGIHFTKVVDSYESRGITLDLLNVIAELQFHQFFSSKLASNITEDQEIYDSFVSENMLCDLKPLGVNVCILEN